MDDAEAEQAKIEGALQKGKKHMEDVKKDKDKLAATLAKETKEKRELEAQAQRSADQIASLLQKQNTAFVPVKSELLSFKIKVGSEKTRGTVTVVEDSEESQDSSSSSGDSSSSEEEDGGAAHPAAAAAAPERSPERRLTGPTAVKSGMPVRPSSLARSPARD